MKHFTRIFVIILFFVSCANVYVYGQDDDTQIEADYKVWEANIVKSYLDSKELMSIVNAKSQSEITSFFRKKGGWREAAWGLYKGGDSFIDSVLHIGDEKIQYYSSNIIIDDESPFYQSLGWCYGCGIDVLYFSPNDIALVCYPDNSDEIKHGFKSSGFRNLYSKVQKDAGELGGDLIYELLEKDNYCLFIKTDNFHCDCGETVCMILSNSNDLSSRMKNFVANIDADVPSDMDVADDEDLIQPMVLEQDDDRCEIGGLLLYIFFAIGIVTFVAAIVFLILFLNRKRRKNEKLNKVSSANGTVNNANPFKKAKDFEWAKLIPVACWLGIENCVFELCKCISYYGLVGTGRMLGTTQQYSMDISVFTFIECACWCIIFLCLSYYCKKSINFKSGLFIVTAVLAIQSFILSCFQSDTEFGAVDVFVFMTDIAMYVLMVVLGVLLLKTKINKCVPHALIWGPLVLSFWYMVLMFSIGSETDSLGTFRRALVNYFAGAIMIYVMISIPFARILFHKERN